MFDAFKEIADSVRDASFDLAARALTGFMSLYREVALHVEEQTGFILPLSGTGGEGGYTPDPYLSESSQVTEVTPAPAVEKIPEKKPTAKAPVKAAKDPAKKDASAAKDKAEKASKTTPKAASKKTKKRPTKKRATNKRAAKKSGSKTKKKKGRVNQLVRVLKMLNEDANAWMSASALSKMSEEQGSKILPGNVRKVIRQRGEPYIETRPRAGSRRGSLEFHITGDGLNHLKEVEGK